MKTNKHILNKLLIIGMLFGLLNEVQAQNIGVNTTGASPAAANLFEVLQPSNTASYRGIYTLHSGTGANSTGIYAEHTGAVAGSTGYAFQAIKSGASLTNIAAYLNSTGGTSNYSLIVPAEGGNVGIGTTTPASQLVVVDQDNAGVEFIQYSNADGANIRAKRARGTIASPTAVLAGDRIASLTGFGYDGSSFVGQRGAFSIHAEENYTLTNNGTYLAFVTTPNGSTATAERLRITAAGNVGIGSAAPGNKLTLYGTASNLAGPHLSAFTDADASNPVFQILNWNSTNVSLSFGSFYDGAWKSSDAGSSFQVYKLSNVFRIRYGVAAAGAAVTWNEGISLLTTGNVGVGTASPIEKLHVSGGDGIQFSDGSLTFRFGEYSDNINTRTWTYLTRGSGAGYGSLAVGDLYVSGDQAELSGAAYFGGNVGIGTTGPAQSLHTTGSIQFDARYAYFGVDQYLYGDNSSALYYNNNHSTVTQLIMRDKEGTQYGRVYGSGDGVNFGLLDGDGNWSYLAAKDSYTAFRINDIEKARVTTTGFDVTGKVTSDGINETSDVRLKKNITNLINALEKVKQLQGVTYEWKNLDEILNDGIDSSKFIDNKNVELGFIAQEVEKIVPELVNTDTTGFKSVQYSKIVALLNEAIKELKIELDYERTFNQQQQELIENLSTENSSMKSDIGILKSENEIIKTNYTQLEKDVQQIKQASLIEAKH